MKNFTLKMMKSLIVLVAVLAFSSVSQSQVVTMEPADATCFDSVTLIFNPAVACFQNATLVGAPQVYMHSGVSIGGQNWQKVIEYNKTGVNGQAPIFLPNPDLAGTYIFRYRPSSFYGIAPGTIVTQLCMVFNGNTWDKDGRNFDPLDPSKCIDIFIPLKFASSAPKFAFEVNMEKKAQSGFDPINDAVYAVLLTPTRDSVELTPGTGASSYLYAGSIETGLDSGTTYTFKYRINNTDYETIDARSMTAMPGTTENKAWWNDDPINAVTFQVDMSYQVKKGAFNPLTDFVDIAGSFNGWGPTPPAMLTRVAGTADTVYLYKIDIVLQSDSVYDYKYRVNASWATSEFPGGGPNRKVWAPKTPKTCAVVYDNYLPGTVPITFKCHMSYQISAGHFDPKHDYLDIAGNLEGWGAYDVLFTYANPTEYVYEITLNADRAYIGGSPVEFKFRFNGDWSTSEFPGGGPNRKYNLQDTVGGVVNLVDVWYSDLNPSIPTPPWAYDILFTGEGVVGQNLEASYTYENVNGIAEGASTFKWYAADDKTGTNETVIPGILTKGYSPTAAETHKYLAFEVTPIAASGDSAVGKPVKQYMDDPIGGVGVIEVGKTNINFYPNPVLNTINFDHLNGISRIEIYSIVGQKILVINEISSEKRSINVSNLNSGVYFLKFYGNNSYATAKFIKN